MEEVLVYEGVVRRIAVAEGEQRKSHVKLGVNLDAGMILNLPIDETEAEMFRYGQRVRLSVQVDV